MIRSRRGAVVMRLRCLRFAIWFYGNLRERMSLTKHDDDVLRADQRTREGGKTRLSDPGKLDAGKSFVSVWPSLITIT